jgi:hypothetical protein
MLPANSTSGHCSDEVLEANDFASSVAMNNGNGTFTLAPLPVEAQFAPIYSVLADDFDARNDDRLAIIRPSYSQRTVNNPLTNPMP